MLAIRKERIAITVRRSNIRCGAIYAPGSFDGFWPSAEMMSCLLQTPRRHVRNVQGAAEERLFHRFIARKRLLASEKPSR